MNKEIKIRIIIGEIALGLICFSIGGYVFGNTGDIKKELAYANSKVTGLQIQLKKSKDTLDETTTKLTASEAKVKEAQPYFDMQDSEKQALQAKVEKDKADREAKEKAKADEDAKAKLEARTKTLSNGNFVSGKDFDSGIYTITAVAGGGNVSSNNIYDGGINAIMGTQGGMYQAEYKNIRLPSGVTLTISDVTVKLTPVE